MKFDENLSAIHGYLCGDGYVIRNPKNQKHKYYTIGFRNTNFNLLMDFQRKFRRNFGLNPRISKDKDRCKIGNKEIYFILTESFSYYSYEWKIPKLSKQNLKYWLRAFFDCEAWVENQPAKSRLIGLDCCNKEGLFGVKKSLEKLGIYCNIGKRKDRTIWGLKICGLDNLKRFRKNIGFNHPRKSKKLDEAINSYVNYYWDIPLDKENLLKFIKSKGKPETRRIMFYTIKLKNLSELKKILNRYHSLTVRKEDLWNEKSLVNLKK
tara:strand:+ start:1158 stop:1952 length:795 start_codon:yes stop_codon:yes gene_type:complete